MMFLRVVLMSGLVAGAVCLTIVRASVDRSLGSCELHHTSLREDMVPLYRGELVLPRATSNFPNARLFLASPTASEKTIRVPALYCPACRKAEKAWSAGRKP